MTPLFPESPQDWINAKPGKIYYNSKTDEFTSTFITDKQLIPPGDVEQEAKKYYSNFVINVLRNLNKKEDTALELEASVAVAGNYIDPSPLIREKVLLTIPKSSFDNIEEKKDVSIVELTTVVYDLNNFFQRLENVAKKFEDYQSQYISNVFSNSTNPFNNVDFLLEAENLYTLGSNIKTLVESNSVDLAKFKKIQISFESGSFVAKICLIDGIDSVNMKYLFEEFKNGYPQNYPQTLIFLSQLSDLEQRIKSTGDNYESIVRDYFINSSKKRAKSTDLIARASSKGSTSASKNQDISKQIASTKEITKRSAKLLQREILNSVYRTPCMTPDQRDKINRQLERETEKKANFARKLSISVSDTFFENLPSVLQQVANKQGDEALKYLGRNLLNRLGLCGIGDLTSLVTNTVFAYIDEQEYVDELSKCAVRNLDNDKVSKLWKDVGRFGKNAEILERYRKFVGDTIPPWTTGGYIPPDYNKDLNTDDAVVAQYTLKIKTAEEDTDIDFRFGAFRNAIAASIRGEELLDVLVNSFPDEMGWLGFFTDMTKGILNKCKVPMPNIGASVDFNWCQDRINLPEFEDIPKSNASFTFKPSEIGVILVEEIKNIIINLTVRVIIETMRQMFQIIAAGMSFDEDYFKKNQWVPDLFQDESAIQKQIADYCKEPSSNFRQVNSSVREIFQNKFPDQYIQNPLSLEDIDRFLKSCSVGLGHYDKVRLYNGDGTESTSDKVLGLIKDIKVSEYMRNYGDVDQVFLAIGNLLDVEQIQDQFYQSLQNTSLPEVGYCGNEFDNIRQGYLNNKPEITEEQISEMKEVLKDIQKDKICFAAETLGNSNGVILGQLFETLKSKQGPIFSRISDHLGKLFEPVIEKQIDTVSKNYRNDLFNSRGLLDLILVNENGIGENRRLLSSFFTLTDKAEARPVPESMENSRINESIYSPTKSAANIVLGFQEGSASYIDEAPKSGDFETGADKIQSLLIKNQSVLRDSLNRKISTNFIDNGVLTSIVEEYFSDLRFKLLNRTYGPSWTRIYDTIKNNDDLIPLILGEERIIETAKELYGSIGAFGEDYKYVPFNALKSKEEAALTYATFLMLVNTISSEILMKNLPIYEAFGAELLHDFDYLGDYVYDKFIGTIEEFAKKPKVLEKLVQVVILASNEDIMPPLPSSLSINIERINTNIAKWVGGERGNKTENLEKNIEDIEAITKFFVKDAAFKYIAEFQKSMSIVEDNKFPSINKTNTIYKYIFEESLLSAAQNVIVNPNNVGLLDKGLRLEKYIILNGANAGLPSGVQNLQEFQAYLDDNPQIKGDISENWSSWSFGIRISSIYDLAKSGVSDDDISLDLRNQKKAFTLFSDSESETVEKYFLSPLVVYEEEIPDQPVSSDIIKSYDENSMKKALSEINDFLNFYYRGMNIENLISLATIYIDEEFGTFLTNPSTSDPSAAAIALPSTVDSWNGKLLSDTKRFIVNTLERI